MLREKKKTIRKSIKKISQNLLAAITGALLAVARVLAHTLTAKLTASAGSMEFPNVAEGARGARHRVTLLNMKLVLFINQNLSTNLALKVRALTRSTAALTVLVRTSIVATSGALRTTSAREPAPAIEAKGFGRAKHHEEGNNGENDGEAHLDVSQPLRIILSTKLPVPIYTFGAIPASEHICFDPAGDIPSYSIFTCYLSFYWILTCMVADIRTRYPGPLL